MLKLSSPPNMLCFAVKRETGTKSISALSAPKLESPPLTFGGKHSAELGGSVMCHDIANLHEVCILNTH